MFIAFDRGWGWRVALFEALADDFAAMGIGQVFEGQEFFDEVAEVWLSGEEEFCEGGFIGGGGDAWFSGRQGLAGARARSGGGLAQGLEFVEVGDDGSLAYVEFGGGLAHEGVAQDFAGGVLNRFEQGAYGSGERGGALVGLAGL